MDRLREVLRRIQDARESRFAKKRHLISCGKSGLLRLEPAVYSGPRVVLKSGQEVLSGARIAEIHLDSRKILQAYESMPPMKARLGFFRQAQEGFAWAAEWLLRDPTGRETEALLSVTLLDREMMHFGFETMALPVWPWLFVGIHMRWLDYLYRGSSSARKQNASSGAAPFIKQIIPRQAWMGRQEFLQRYRGQGIQSP